MSVEMEGRGLRYRISIFRIGEEEEDSLTPGDGDRNFFQGCLNPPLNGLIVYRNSSLMEKNKTDSGVWSHSAFLCGPHCLFDLSALE